MGHSLKPLIDLLNNLGDDNSFDMERWFHHCGTPACSAGWATTIPEYQKAGLRVSGSHRLGPTPEFEGGTGLYALQKFFGLGHFNTDLAFDPFALDRQDVSYCAGFVGVPRDPSEWTPKDAAKILSFVESRR